MSDQGLRPLAEQGEEIERLKAELVEATEMALGQAKTLIERDKQIDELKTESKILETTIQELRGTDWAAVNIESQKRIAELERMWLVVFDGHAVYQACGDDRITPSLLSSILDGVAKAGKEAVDRLREGEKG